MYAIYIYIYITYTYIHKYYTAKVLGRIVVLGLYKWDIVLIFKCKPRFHKLPGKREKQMRIVSKTQYRSYYNIPTKVYYIYYTYWMIRSIVTLVLGQIKTRFIILFIYLFFLLIQ